MSQLVGVVLAGGSGNRLGRTKGDLVMEGTPLAVRAAGILWPLCGSVLVSLEPGADNPAPEHAAVFDAPPPGRGPLAGIQAAYRATGQSDLLVLACDYPLMNGRTMKAVVEAYRPEDDLVMLTDGSGRDHPLAGLWRRCAESTVSLALDEGRYKVRGLLADLAVRRLGPADLPDSDLDRVLTNLNRPEDLARVTGESP